MNIEKKHIIVAGVPRTGKTTSICKKNQLKQGTTNARRLY